MMHNMRKLHFFLILTCSSLLLRVDSRQNQISKVINGLLDGIANGSSIEEVEMVRGKLKLTDVFIEPINMSKIIDGHKFLGVRTEVNVTEILVRGNYDIRPIQIRGLFPVYGKGNFGANLTEFHLKFDMNAQRNFLQEKFDVTVTSFNISLKNSEVNFTNLFGETELSNFLSAMISGLIPDFLRVLTIEGRPGLSAIAEHVMNEVLHCIESELLTGRLNECISGIFHKMVAVVTNKFLVENVSVSDESSESSEESNILRLRF
ncbi:hypothetical protein RUM43_000984 [Polyplax serrata]|uniref:Uncharacterized protein n=1 Tax=Polyplax serrata TaxID=468196 RepID=A0AAN8SH47_POLSC